MNRVFTIGLIGIGSFFSLLGGARETANSVKKQSIDFIVNDFVNSKVLIPTDSESLSFRLNKEDRAIGRAFENTETSKQRLIYFLERDLPNSSLLEEVDFTEAHVGTQDGIFQ